MRIVALVNWEGFTQANYEAIRKSINWEGNQPKGIVSHVAAFDEDGGRVTDVWESEAEFKNFLETRLIPGTKAAGIKGEPQVEILPLHAMFVPALVGRAK